ncbi:MAG TPA: hypothetical protein VNA89_09380, partial [Gemmatimonadaceae bacterium]|nr:hypothetical protein [Gemmatimonadaceae bacterium]
LDIRYRTMRNFLATLAFSQGVPMIAHGDEIGRTQQGNNNAYAQDNAISWVDWDLDERQKELLAFTQKVFAIRHLNPVLRRRSFFRGEVVDHSGVKDLTWIRADGQEMAQEDWQNASARSLGMLVHGDATDETDDRGRPIKGDTLLLVLNASDAEVRFAVPTMAGGDAGSNGHGGGGNGDRRRSMWSVLVDTAREEVPSVEGGQVALSPYSVVLLRFGRERRLSSAAGGGGSAAAVNVAAVSTAGEGTPTLAPVAVGAGLETAAGE